MPVSLQTFLENFALLTTAPNAVRRLRDLILQLAVQGKLCTQDARDEPATILLNDVRKEKERQIEEKKSKQLESLPYITDRHNFKHSTPRGWAWAWLGDLARVGDYC